MSTKLLLGGLNKILFAFIFIISKNVKKGSNSFSLLDRTPSGVLLYINVRIVLRDLITSTFNWWTDRIIQLDMDQIHFSRILGKSQHSTISISLANRESYLIILMLSPAVSVNYLKEYSQLQIIVVPRKI